MGKNRVGILGSGHVAQALASGFVEHGYEVMVGTRDISKLQGLQEKNKSVRLGSFEESSEFGEIIVLAVKGTVAEKVVANVATNLKHKTILDTTNPIADVPPENGVLRFFTTLDDALMERLQRQVPDAHFVKAFSCVGNALMVNPKLQGGPPTMFICGDDEGSKKEASDILRTFGWEVSDLGRVQASRAIEPLCMLWCIPGFLQNQWNHAYKVLKS